MSLQQITITYVSTLPSTTSTVVIPIPAGVQGLDSLADTNAAKQTGFSSFDIMLAGIQKSGGVRFVDASGIATWIPLQQIVKVQAE